MLLSVGDRVGSGSFHLHSRFRRVANFHNRRGFVSVVDERVGPGPLHVVLPRFDPAGFSRLRIAEACLHLDGRRFSMRAVDRYDSTLPAGEVERERFVRNRNSFGALLAREAPDESIAFLLREEAPAALRHGFRGAFALHVRRSVDLLFSRGSLDGVRELSGCGLGFTPSGDDFLVGLLLGMHLLERVDGLDLSGVRSEIFERARRGEPMADARLGLAKAGHVFPVQRHLVCALFRAGTEEVRRRTRDLLAVGSTSGADMGTGLFLTLRGGVARWL